MSKAIPAVSLQEFLSTEEHGQLRHEFVGGRVYLHAGGTQRHDLLAGLIYEAPAPGRPRQGCLPFFGNRMLVTPAGDAYYPDAFLACGGGA